MIVAEKQISSLTVPQAIALQREMAGQVRIENDFKKLDIIAGVDVSYDVKNNQSCAAIVLIKRATLEIIQTIIAHDVTQFPYVSGLLSFREIPVIEKAFRQIKTMPDILMVDGQGIAHPRRLGIAAHLGVLMDMPAIGVAKSRLTGYYKEPGNDKGDQTVLLDKKEQIGTVLRSKDKTKVLFISPGHRVDHKTAVDLVLGCLTRYRLPEPTRLADKLSRQYKDKEAMLL